MTPRLALGHLAALVLALFLALPAWAQARHALVVGIDRYDRIDDLRSARNDARAVGAALEGAGFAATVLLDVDRRELLRGLADFARRLNPGDEAVFYFAGHGVEVAGRNYLLPADIPALAPGDEVILDSEALPVDRVLAAITERGVRLSLLILDACRDNPFPRQGTRSLGTTRGLARLEPPGGTMIVFSAGAGQAALDRLGPTDTDPNSVFTRVLLPLIQEPGLPLHEAARQLRAEVQRLAATARHDQRPAVYDETIGDFVLVAAGAAQPAPTPALTPAADPDWTRATSVTLSGHANAINSVAFSPDGGRVVTAASDNTALVWDAATGRVIATLGGHTSSVTDAGFSSDGARVVTASVDRTARIWDATTGRVISTLSGHTGSVRSAAFSPDGRRVVTASGDWTARLWDATTGREITAFDAGYRVLTGAEFSPDGGRVVTASVDRTARVWDAATRRSLATLSGHVGPVNSAAFSPDGGQVVTASDDGTARVWDAATGRWIATFSGHAGWLFSAAFSPDGRKVVTASGDMTARIWDAATGRVIATLSGHRAPVTSAAFSPDGRRIVTASSDNTARIWTAP